MLDLSWSEILVIGVAALLLIGPKELPGALRTLGQWTGRARALAREFQRNLDEMIHESEIQKLKEQAEQAANFDFKRSVETTIDPKGEITKSFTPPEALDTPPAEPTAPDAAPQPAGSSEAPTAPTEPANKPNSPS